MEEFVKGDVDVIPFPFSDLSQTKPVLNPPKVDVTSDCYGRRVSSVSVPSTECVSSFACHLVPLSSAEGVSSVCIQTCLQRSVSTACAYKGVSPALHAKA